MSKVQIMDHPLIQHKITYIRREEVGSKEFREIVGEIAALMCYEATRDLKVEDVKIKTPICEMVGKELSGKKLAVVPILRAGIGMVDGILNMIPAAKVGHIGLYRDPDTFEPVEYFCKLPADCDEREVFGGSHAGNGRIQRGGHPDAEGQGREAHPFLMHHCRSGRGGADDPGASGCGSLHRGAGRPSERA